MYCIFILPIVTVHIHKPRRHWENKKIIPYPNASAERAAIHQDVFGQLNSMGMDARELTKQPQSR